MNNTSRYIHKLIDSPIANIVFDRATKVNPGVNTNNILVILGVQWSDDFEPNSSSKSNRGSVWIKTVSFISSSTSKNELSDTYPISIRLKASEHQNIESMFVQECSELSQGKNNVFYSMQENKNAHVHFEIIASLGDQPERRSINYLMLGNSTFFLDIVMLQTWDQFGIIYLRVVIVIQK